MNDNELKNIWKEYDQKIAESKILNMQSWVLNLQSFEYIQQDKARRKLNALSKYKQWMVFFGILWALFLVFLVVNSLEYQKIFFVISAGSIAVFTIIAIIVYLKHVYLINQIDNTESVVTAIEKTASLQKSTLGVTRILFLQSPFYCTFWWTPHMIHDAPLAFWFISFPIAMLFAGLSLWLYRNISYKNMHKKWFTILFSGKEWTSVIKAMQYLDEVAEFKKDLTSS
jgi:hypothetical protein